MNITWNVNSKTGTTPLVYGCNHITVSVEGSSIREITGEIIVPPAEKMFFNGYQTWTHCPEYTKRDRIRGMQRIPRFGVRRFALDRYADYHFVDYPFKRGVLHGFSYCYFRDGGQYRLFASLDEAPGYTMFSYNVKTRILTVSRDAKGVAAFGEYPVFDLFIAEGTGEKVFSEWFEALGIHNNPPKLKGYSSWYNHYQKISEKTIGDDLEGAVKVFDKGDLFQIDDGWETFVGDWEAPDPVKFPNGLKAIADRIHAQNLKAGLWLAPFICEEKSELFKNHRDWLLEHDHKPWKDGCNWSGFYSLDIDKPEVQEYLRAVFTRVFDEWGFDLVKLDFLYAAAPFATGDYGDTGNPEDSAAAFPESRAARMIRALKFLRELCGDKLILGCGVPVMPAFGLTDYCRISCDVGLDWNDKLYMRIIHRERVSTKHAVENTVFRRQLDGLAHGNDPDVFFLRDTNIRLSDEQKDYLATVNSLFGTVFLTSDNLKDYSEEQIRRYRHYASLMNAEDKSVDPDTLTVSYVLNGTRYTVKHPQKS